MAYERVIIWMDREAEPITIDAVTMADAIIEADKLGALWIAIGGVLAGKTIIDGGKWMRVEL